MVSRALKAEIKKTTNALEKMKKENATALDAGMRKTMNRAGLILKNEMQSRAPVGSGQLRNAVWYEVITENGRPVVYVGLGERTPMMARKWKRRGFLAIFHEFGTRKMKATPFVGPAYQATKEQLKRIIWMDLGRIVRGIGRKP